MVNGFFGCCMLLTNNLECSGVGARGNGVLTPFSRYALK